MNNLLNNKHLCSGLTLIEVLLALVILSIGISSMMFAMSQTLSVIRTARNQEIAQNLIRRIDIEFPIEKVDFAESLESGNFSDIENYSWQREILILDEEKRPGLFITKKRIIWEERGQIKIEEIELYTYAPEAESVTKEIN
tara:strand:+ start:558 stop:980 length:423 start_codon:yes stop_codon:yes gene_type:complete